MEQTAVPAARTEIAPYVGLAVLVGIVLVGWAAPSSYEIYKMLHVLAAVVWVGGGVLLTILALLTLERSGRARQHRAELVGARIFTPASVIVVVFGIAMIEKGDLGWDHFWID